MPPTARGQPLPIYIYLSMSIYLYISISIYIYIYTHTYIYTYIYIYIRRRETHSRWWGHIDIDIDICLFVYIHIYIPACHQPRGTKSSSPASTTASRGGCDTAREKQVTHTNTRQEQHHKRPPKDRPPYLTGSCDAAREKQVTYTNISPSSGALNLHQDISPKIMFITCTRRGDT